MSFTTDLTCKFIKNTTESGGNKLINRFCPNEDSEGYMPPYTLQVSPKTYYNFTFKNVKFKLSSLQVDKGFYALTDL